MSKDLSDILLDILREIKEDLKDVKTNIGDIKITNVEQNSQLAEHTRRSLASENRLDILEREIIPQIVEKLTPKPINWRKTISWIVGTLLTIISILAGIGKMAGWF